MAWLPDGKRLHLRYGALDAVIQAHGWPRVVGRAYDAAIARARDILLELDGTEPEGTVARRALAADAAVPHGTGPGAALAGAVADELLDAMCVAGLLDRAFVNNHGAVALHLAEGQSFTAEAIDWPWRPLLAGRLPRAWPGSAQALASTGWQSADGGQDTITVAAGCAAGAAAAAAAIAAVMFPGGGPMLVPRPLPDGLTPEAVARALAQGFERAGLLRSVGAVAWVLFSLRGECRLLGPETLAASAQLGSG